MKDIHHKIYMMKILIEKKEHFQMKMNQLT
jgi:hypothetical protein